MSQSEVAARQAHFLCMGFNNYEKMDMIIEECRAEDAADLIEYENMVMAKQAAKSGENVEPTNLDQEEFSFLDYIRGFVAEKFCVFKVNRGPNPCQLVNCFVLSS